MYTWYSVELIAKDKIRELHKQGLLEQMIHREFGRPKLQPFPTFILKAIGNLKILNELKPLKGSKPGLGDHNAEQPA